MVVAHVIDAFYYECYLRFYVENLWIYNAVFDLSDFVQQEGILIRIYVINFPFISAF